MTAGRAGAASQLATVVRLRAVLELRRVQRRPALERLALFAGPPLGLAVGLLVVSAARGLMLGRSPEAIAAVAGFGLTLAIPVLALDVLRRSASGEGEASALVLFPVEPAVLHVVEALAGAAAPSMLLFAAVHLGLLLALPAPAWATLPWALLGVLWLVALRQFLRLAVGRVLRRRGLREALVALGSLLVPGLWLAVAAFGDRIRVAPIEGVVEQLPAAFWALPVHWFTLPAAPGADLPAALRLSGLVLAPALLALTVHGGAELQRLMLLGETPRSSVTRRRSRLGPLGRLQDRAPLRWVPPAVWATAGKELRLLSRNPFILAMLLSQAALVIALPLLYAAWGVADTRGSGRSEWLPMITLFGLLTLQPLVFNQLGSEGRGLRFLAASPVPRLQVLLGKNLAYVALAGPFLAVALATGALLLREPGLPWALAAASLGLLMLVGVGNLVSVLVPHATLGARRTEGGDRGASAAAAGSVEPSGCLTAIVGLLATGFLVASMVPVALGLWAAAHWGGGIAVAATLGLLAWALLVWLVLTAAAALRLELAEEQLLLQIAGRETG